MSENPAPVVPALTRNIPTQHKGTQTDPEKKKATRGIHVQTEQVLRVVNPEVTEIPKKDKPLIRKMPANKYENAVPPKRTQEKETLEPVVATSKEEKVSLAEIKADKIDGDLNGYIIPHKKPGQVDVKENIEDNNENEEADKEQDQMNKESDEKPQQIDEGEGSAEQDQAKDTDDPVNADTPELREKHLLSKRCMEMVQEFFSRNQICPNLYQKIKVMCCHLCLTAVILNPKMMIMIHLQVATKQCSAKYAQVYIYLIALCNNLFLLNQVIDLLDSLRS